MSILIHNCTAVLMDEAGTVLPNAYVVVEGTKIRSVSTQRPWGSFEEQIDGQGNVLMPGFVNAHSHVPMTAMRGLRRRQQPPGLAAQLYLPGGGPLGRPGHPGLYRPGPGGD